jgi:F-box and WD-40 domain protein CDC4
MDSYRRLSLTERRASMVLSNEDLEMSPTRGTTLTLNTTSHVRLPPRVEKVSRPRGPPTPNMMTPSADPDSPTHSSHDPPPPPTPAASPGPDQSQPDWSDAGDQEDFFLSQMRHHFKNRTHSERTRILGDLLNLCTSQQLSFVRQFVDPLLKKDPFTSLPNEICLRVWYLLVHLVSGSNSSFRFFPASTTRRCLHEPHKSRRDGKICYEMM